MPLTDPFRQIYRNDSIQTLKDSFSLVSGNYWLVGIGKNDTWISATGVNQDDNPPSNIDSIKSDTDFWRKVFAFKKINSDEICLVVRRIDWERGQIYDAYRDDIDLYDDDNPANFYILVDEERVYKCIDNNYEAQSTVAPTHTDYQIRTLSDGYRWKYLYSIPDSKRKFLTKSSAGILGYMPIEHIDYINENDERILQWDVQNAAVDGSIDFIALDQDLKSLVISDRVIFAASENQIASSVTAGSSTVILSGPNLVFSNDYYKNFILKIDSGMGAGQQRVITNYVAGSNTATVTLDSPLDVGLTSGTGSDASLYSIYPYIEINGDGTSYNNSLYTNSTSSQVSALFGDSVTGSTGAKYIDSIEIVDSGKDYTYADLNIISGLTFISGVTGNINNLARAIMSPQGGHGFDPTKELGAAAIMISTEFNQDENNNITIENDYRQFAILKNCKLYYPQVKLYLSYAGLSSSFAVGNTASQGYTGFSGSTGFDFATGKIIEWTAGSTGTTGTAELVLDRISLTFGIGGIINGITNFNITDIKYNYYAGQENNNYTRLKLSSSIPFSGVDFTTNYYAIGVGNSASNISPSRSTGRIIGWDVDNGNDYIGNLYVEGNNKFTLNEYISQMPPNLLVSSLNNIGKVIEIGEGQESTSYFYDQTSIINISYDGAVSLTSTSYSLDDVISSLSGGNVIGTASVIDWNYGASGTTGDLRILNLTGSFNVGNKILYNNSLTGASISSIVSTPDILYHSGDVMYLKNIRSITRSIEQKEEIKLIIQF